MKNFYQTGDGWPRISLKEFHDFQVKNLKIKNKEFTLKFFYYVGNFS